MGEGGRLILLKSQWWGRRGKNKFAVVVQKRKGGKKKKKNGIFAAKRTGVLRPVRGETGVLARGGEKESQTI